MRSSLNNVLCKRKMKNLWDYLHWSFSAKEENICYQIIQQKSNEKVKEKKKLKYDKFMRRGNKRHKRLKIEMRITSQHNVSWSSRNRREKTRRKKEMLQWRPYARTVCLNLKTRARFWQQPWSWIRVETHQLSSELDLIIKFSTRPGIDSLPSSNPIVSFPIQSQV